MFEINIMAVLVATIVAYVLGFLFHGPVSGKLWMKLANIQPTGNEKLSDMIPQLLWNLLAQFITVFIFAIVYLLASSSAYLEIGIWGGVTLAFLVWLGFLVTSSSIEVIWMGRNYKLWLFEAGCSFVVMLSVGAIIASWAN